MLQPDDKRKVLALEELSLRERRIIADWDDDWGSTYTTRSESLFGVMDVIHERVKASFDTERLAKDVEFQEYVSLMQDLLDSPVPFTNGAFARSACPPA